jgi:hypothetical protein
VTAADALAGLLPHAHRLAAGDLVAGVRTVAS